MELLKPRTRTKTKTKEEVCLGLLKIKLKGAGFLALLRISSQAMGCLELDRQILSSR